MGIQTPPDMKRMSEGSTDADGGLKGAQRRIRQIYGISATDQEKNEAAEALAGRELEKDSQGLDCAWSENELREFKAAVEIVSGGTNTVIADDFGIPSVMVRVPLLKNSQLLQHGSERVHPAFLLNGEPQEALYISKFQNILINGRGYSLPLKDPACGVTFGLADSACRSKGEGWHLTSFALRAALALWSKRNGFLPHGNSDAGHDFLHKDETGIPTGEGRVATGSGPVTWTHNRNWDGIFDLNGNLNERDGGLRLLNGEIQIIPDGDCALPDCDMSEKSSDWKAILPDGSLTVPGSPNTLKYDFSGDHILLTTHAGKHTAGPHGCAFGDIRAEEGLVVPELLYSLMLFPEDRADAYDGWRWINPDGECFPLSGGGYHADNHAGVFFVGLTYPREKDYGLVGFRSACIKRSEKR